MLTKKQGSKIRPKHIGQDVCGTALANPGQSVIKDSCEAARQVMRNAQTRLKSQLKELGVGYSYNVNPGRGKGNISSIHPDILKNNQLWVKHTDKYPNGNATASDAARLVNHSYAGLTGWRGAGIKDWGDLLAGLDGKNAYREPAEREGYLDRTLVGALGFGGFNGYGNNGRRAVIWLDTQTTPFLGRDMNNGSAFCLLIPYSIRNHNETGGGRPLCSGNDIKDVLMPRDHIMELGRGSRSNEWLEKATTTMNTETPFVFGSASYYTKGTAMLIITVEDETKGFHRYVYPDEERRKFNTVVPTWVQRSDIFDGSGTKTGEVNLTIDQRDPQVIFPVYDIDPGKCKANEKTTNINRVLVMCGDEYQAWLNKVLKPFKA